MLIRTLLNYCLNNSKVEKLIDRSAYDELEKGLALRTYEESGNYVVEDFFEITMRENLDDNFNNGVYKLALLLLVVTLHPKTSML